MDAGKSTLLGVLTHGELDNGRGFARQKLFRHKHEMESGRTSSVGNDILGFDQEGQVRAREVTEQRSLLVATHLKEKLLLKFGIILYTDSLSVRGFSTILIHGNLPQKLATNHKRDRKASLLSI